MTSGGFAVVPEQLEAHAGTLEGLAGDLAKAVEAANAATMHGEAYGKICWFFVPVIQHISEPCRTQLEQADGTLRRAASEVARTGSDYREVDKGNAAGLRVEGW